MSSNRVSGITIRLTDLLWQSSQGYNNETQSAGDERAIARKLDSCITLQTHCYLTGETFSWSSELLLAGYVMTYKGRSLCVTPSAQLSPSQSHFQKVLFYFALTRLAISSRNSVLQANLFRDCGQSLRHTITTLQDTTNSYHPSTSPPSSPKVPRGGRKGTLLTAGDALWQHYRQG